MISAQMQPIRMGTLSDLAPTVEAYMATYLAHYNNAPVSARMLQSYQRAWGVNTITMFPRVDGGRPGFALLRWFDGAIEKQIVAIEGTSERTSWWNRATGVVGSSVVGTFTGRYWGTAVTYANQIKAILDATGLFPAILARPNSLVEFAGFSIGAGIAEVLSYVYAAANPNRQFFLYKFGAPRFGNSRWNANRNRRVPVVNVYCHRDPVHFMPATGTRMSFSEGLLANPIVESYERDPVVSTYDLNGIPTSAYSSTFVGGDIGTIAQYYQTMNADNPWFYHDRHQYRYMFCQNVWVGNDVLAYRLLHLEHNDENSWQTNFRPGRGVQNDMFVLQSPVPDDVVPETPSVIAAAQQPPPSQAILPQNAFGGVGGGEDADWNGVQPVAARRPRNGRTRRVPA